MLRSGQVRPRLPHGGAPNRHSAYGVLACESSVRRARSDSAPDLANLLIRQNCVPAAFASTIGLVAMPDVDHVAHVPFMRAGVEVAHIDAHVVVTGVQHMQVARITMGRYPYRASCGHTDTITASDDDGRPPLPAVDRDAFIGRRGCSLFDQGAKPAVPAPGRVRFTLCHVRSSRVRREGSGVGRRCSSTGGPFLFSSGRHRQFFGGNPDART